MGSFFVPHAKDATQAESVYNSVRAFMNQQGFSLTPRRIERLIYRHDGKRYDSVVGQKETGIGEEVLAILEVSGSGPRYLVCTANRGVVRGGPVMVGDEYATVVDFDRV